MKIWVVHLKTAGKKTTDEMKQFYINNRIIALGWYVEEITEEMNANEYILKSQVKFPDETISIRRYSNNYHEILAGDIILTKCGVNYYIGLASSESVAYVDHYRIHIPTEFGASWIRSVENWYLLGDQSGTPPLIVSCLTNRNSKTILRKVNKLSNQVFFEISKMAFNNASGTNHFDLNRNEKLSVDNYSYLLDPNDLEDLVGLYLMDSKNYLMYPSSCKKNTTEYEYILFDKKEMKKVYVQVKNREKVDVSRYISSNYIGSKVFLFSAMGYSNIKQKNNEIEIIEKEKLFNYFIKNLVFFQSRTRHYYEF